MNDEANSHWLSIVQQLTTGHQWLLDNLGYIPKNSWAIDPFGHSSTQPYLLKLAGFENSLIQRIHYRVKKELASNRQLEFKWRQLWDPKVCCQFDFKRLPGNGVTCPWGVAPRKITYKNVEESNVVLFPLGDDFRYDRSNEWDNQYSNYEMLIEYINGNDDWNAEVQFSEIKMSDFPVLSGDFFTYADRNAHYWSGYYTSRPFYKNMDRVLLAYLRDRVEQARRALALFQHHDGQAAYYLLKEPPIKDQTQDDIYFDVDDIWRKHDEIPAKITIALDVVSPSRRIVLYNALAFKRHEILTVLVSSPHVEVFDPEGNPMMAQISPAVAGEKRLGFAENKFQLSFPVTVDPLALTIYTPGARLMEDITFQAGNSTRVVTNRNGLIKALVSTDGTTYDTQKDKDSNSGAYLFIPKGHAQEFKADAFPEIVVTEGVYKATLYTALSVEISNSFLIDPQVDDLELAMRFATDIKNGDVFYTDLNGMQMIKRRYFEKIPLQANFYPLPAAAYIENRRLSRDDNRGLNQGVLDNVRTRHTFKLIHEFANTPCKLKPPPEHPSGQLSLGAHVAQQMLLQPMIAMHYSARAGAERPLYARSIAAAADVVLASYHAHVHAKCVHVEQGKDGGTTAGMGLTFQRVHLDACYGKKDTAKWYPPGDGQVQLSDFVDAPPDRMYESSLTYVHLQSALPRGVLTLCPMEVRSVFINHTLKHG
ncbi:Alpha-mannosidase [Operophtera brumata]|uniref:Alpha-mannosidase n=1 Tax=Operophtera brumata TaxID=104452 RepID=A0A0L7LNU1_OPEBR|nr:Alpha-mannosidase [Operophtera brumata]